MDRRDFLSQLGSMAAASGMALTAGSQAAEKPSSAAGPLPTISLGQHRVTRLIAGSNPINGNSYLGPHMDRHMREYFTVDRAADFLLACERAGINTHQFSTGALKKSEKTVRKIRERGSRMQLICLGRRRDEIPKAIQATRPIAMVHHGGATDSAFAQGKSREVHDFVKAVHDQGILAGVSAHNPDCIKRIADEGWEVDLFMTCLYFLTRKLFQKEGEPKNEPETLPVGPYHFYQKDPEVMIRVVRQVRQPCLAFKILAAGRLCRSQELVRGVFRGVFANIKPTDGVIVGMYPELFDEISANAKYTREFGEVQPTT